MTILIASIIGILIIFQTECSKRNEGMPNVNDHMRLKKMAKDHLMEISAHDRYFAI